MTKKIEKNKPKKSKSVSAKRGRPTIYTPELGEKICRALENSPRGLQWHCTVNDDLPIAETIREWLRLDKFPEFSKRYCEARMAQADFLSDEIIDVTYDAATDKYGRMEKQKLMVDALKWKAKVLKPKVYGDKPELFLNTDGDKPTTENSATIAERISKISEIIEKKSKLHGKNV